MRLSRTSTTETANNAQIYLTYDDLGEILFDILKIDPNDCVGFDFNTGRYDTRHIKLKPSIDANAYITSTPSPSRTTMSQLPSS